MRALALVTFVLALLPLASCAEGGGSGGSCGNHVCDLGEDHLSCPQDCVAAVCGDGVCATSESTVTCLTDCYCGNGTCDVGESLGSCPGDCTTGRVCGNGTCEAGETATSCPQDCSTGPVCGNGTCELGENSANCAADCSSGAVCGNGTCEAGETSASCPQDCSTGPVCGNGTCETGETSSNCPQDCTSGPVCGNGVCETGETTTSCAADCGSGCEDATCDMVPACGCGNGEKCTILTGSTHVCVDAGSTPVGDACSAETDCQEGAICIGDGAGHSMCMAWCETTNDCPGGAGAACIYTLNDGNGGTVPGVMLCSVDCSPVNPSGSCPSGWNCDIFVDDSSNYLTDCTYTGSTNTGSACTDSTECAPGYLCDTYYGNCAAYCVVGGTPCAVGGCYDAAVTIGGVSYGICDPAL